MALQFEEHQAEIKLQEYHIPTTATAFAILAMIDHIYKSAKRKLHCKSCVVLKASASINSENPVYILGCQKCCNISTCFFSTVDMLQTPLTMIPLFSASTERWNLKRIPQIS